MGKKKKKQVPSVVEPIKPAPDVAVKVTKEFSLCRDGTKKRSKEDGIAFFKEQRDQAALDGNDELATRLTAIINNLTGGLTNGLRIEPDRVRKKSK